MLSIFMLCVFWLHESRGQPGAKCVWQAEERQPTANVRVDSSPHLFSFSLGSLGLQDRPINHQKQHTCSVVTFNYADKRSSSQVVQKARLSLTHIHTPLALTTCNRHECQPVSCWCSRLHFLWDLKKFLSISSSAELCSAGWTKEGLCHKDNRIISPVFMDISVSRRLSHILCHWSARHCPNLIPWTGEKSHVMFLTRSRSSGTE